jgi:hypothetical protein
MLPIAAWQQPGGHSSHESVQRLARKVPELLAHYLRQLPASTHYVLVGQLPPALGQLPADRTHVVPACSPVDYSELLGSVDAVLGLTPPALTLLRAVLADIPAMVLTNRFGVHDEAEVERVDAELGGLTPHVRAWLGQAGPVYPFRLWPMSFYRFMTPLLSGNPYLSAVTSAELLDERGVVDGLAAMLYDPTVRAEQAAARAGYQTLLDSLPPTREVFAAAVKRLGLASRVG